MSQYATLKARQYAEACAILNGPRVQVSDVFPLPRVNAPRAALTEHPTRDIPIHPRRHLFAALRSAQGRQRGLTLRPA